MLLTNYGCHYNNWIQTMLIHWCQFWSNSTPRRHITGCLKRSSSKAKLTYGKRRPITQQPHISQLKLQNMQSQSCGNGFQSSNIKRFQHQSIGGFPSFPQPLHNSLHQNLSRSHYSFDNQVWLKVQSMSKFIRGGYPNHIFIILTCIGLGYPNLYWRPL